MKYIKKFENKHDELAKIVQETIIKDNKVINNFSVYFDWMSGAIEWSNGNYVFYATPYWDGGKILPINISNIDGDEIEQTNIDLPTLKTNEDITNILNFYYKKIDKITKLLNERTKLKNIIEIISNSIGNIYLDKYKLHIEDISPDQIPTSDIYNLLKFFNKEYQHIIQSNKFNL